MNNFSEARHASTGAAMMNFRSRDRSQTALINSGE